jgi:hypothetical protein
LAPYAAGFEDALARQGYRSPTDHLYVMAQLSRWLLIEQLKPADLTAAGLEVRFVQEEVPFEVTAGEDACEPSVLRELLVAQESTGMP